MILFQGLINLVLLSHGQSNVCRFVMRKTLEPVIGGHSTNATPQSLALTVFGVDTDKASMAT